MKTKIIVSKKDLPLLIDACTCIDVTIIGTVVKHETQNVEVNVKFDFPHNLFYLGSIFQINNTLNRN